MMVPGPNINMSENRPNPGMYGFNTMAPGGMNPLPGG